MKYSVREIEKTVCQILDEVSYGKVESSDLDFETDLLKLAIDCIKKLNLAIVDTHGTSGIYIEHTLLSVTYAGYKFYEDFSNKLKWEEEIKINSSVRGQRANSRINIYDELAFKRKLTTQEVADSIDFNIIEKYDDGVDAVFQSRFLKNKLEKYYD